MKNRVYISVLLVVLLVAAALAILVATDERDLAVAPEAARSFPEHSAGDLPPRGSLGGNDAGELALASSLPENSAGDLPPRGILRSAVVYDSPDGGGTLSGDDAYDPAAAAGLPILLSIDDLAAASLSGDDAYDPAVSAAGLPIVLTIGDSAAASFSGDDAYDPAAAAAGLPLVLSISDLAGASFSGDDAYDPAAGGLGGAGGIDLIFGAGSEFGACSISKGVLWGYC